MENTSQDRKNSPLAEDQKGLARETPAMPPEKHGLPKQPSARMLRRMATKLGAKEEKMTLLGASGKPTKTQLEKAWERLNERLVDKAITDYSKPSPFELIGKDSSGERKDIGKPGFWSLFQRLFSR